MKARKSQMEILGLAIVVILVSLGFLFILKFNISKKPSEIQKGFTKVELASNFINSLLTTTSKDCYDLSFTEIFQDCGKGTPILCENGQESCNYMEDNTKEILKKTFDTWNVNYEFKAYSNPDYNHIELISFLGGCPAERTSKFFPLPGITLRMDLC